MRCVLAADGSARVDRTGPGRGAWLCAASPDACFELAVRRRSFERAWRRPVGADALAALRDALGAERVHERVRRDDEKG